MSILNLGLGDATIKFIAKYKVDDPVKTTKIANTSYGFYLLISMVGLFAAYTYLILEKNVPLFLGSDKNHFLDLLKLGVALFGIRLIEQIVFSIYKGFERFDLFSKVSVGSKTILVLTNIIVVYLGYSLSTILLFSILSSLAFLLLELVLLKKFLNGFSIFPKFDKEVFSEIMVFGLWSWVQSIIGILSYQMDKFLVAYFAGVSVLAYYSIGFTIATQVFNVFVAASNWVFPKVSGSTVSNDLIVLYKKLQSAGIFIMCISVTIFFLIKDPILEIWLGTNIYTKSLPYINAYFIFILFTSLSIIPSYFALGTGQIRLLIANSAFSIVLTGLCMYLMFQYYGPVGLVYGRIISGFITIPVFLFLFYRLVLSIPYKYIAFELFLPAFFSALLFIQNTIVTVIALIISITILVYFVKTDLKLKRA